MRFHRGKLIQYQEHARGLHLARLRADGTGLERGEYHEDKLTWGFTIYEKRTQVDR